MLKVVAGAVEHCCSALLVQLCTLDTALQLLAGLLKTSKLVMQCGGSIV